MSIATRKLCALHLVANALLLWLGYEWLGIGESTRLHLVLSAAEALAILALACWLHGATFVYFRAADANLREAFRTAGRKLPLLVAAAILAIVLYGLLAWAASASGQPAFQLASWLTLHLRKPVKPATIARIFQTFFWIVRWIVLPVLVLPVPNWRYWLAVPALLLAGLQLPFVLLRWIPPFENFSMQFASFTLRILLAYLLFVASALMLAFVSGRRRRADHVSAPFNAASL